MTDLSRRRLSGARSLAPSLTNPVLSLLSITHSLSHFAQTTIFDGYDKITSFVVYRPPFNVSEKVLYYPAAT